MGAFVGLSHFPIPKPVNTGPILGHHESVKPGPHSSQCHPFTSFLDHIWDILPV